MIAIPPGVVIEGRLARLEMGEQGKLRGIVVCDRYSAVIGVGEDARTLAGKNVTVENVAATRELNLEQGR